MKRASSAFVFGLACLASVVFAAFWLLRPAFQHAEPATPESSKHAVRPTRAAASRAQAEQAAINATARPCDGTVLTYLDLSRPPTEAELIAAGNLGEPLAPIRTAYPKAIGDPHTQKRQEADNLAFGTAVQAWNQHRYDEAFKLFTLHRRNFPASPWAAETKLHLARYSQDHSRPAAAGDLLEDILKSVPENSRPWHKARRDLAMLRLQQGDLSAAQRDFAAIHRDDPDPHHKTFASYWLREMSLRSKDQTAMNLGAPFRQFDVFPVTNTEPSPQPRYISYLGKDPCECMNCGMPGWSVNMVNMNFRISDTPMWWDPPYGPSVYLTLFYNSLDAQTSFTSFGPKWSFAYVSWLDLTEVDDTRQADVRDGDGRTETFTFTIDNSEYPHAYTSPPGDTRTLVETDLNTFTLTQQDGTIYHYTIPTAMIGTSSVPFLTSIEDRHANTLSITHSATGAILSLAHSTLPNDNDHKWTFQYESILLPDQTTTISRVQSIQDPFGRTATFGYDAVGNLTGQTDMGGQSGGLPGGFLYGYQYTESGELFVSSLRTPKGTTSIATEPADSGALTEEVLGTENLALGYRVGYPPPGFTPMGENYRIHITNAANATEEFHYDSEKYCGFQRDPLQLAAGVDPANGPTTAIPYALIAGRGRVSGRIICPTGINNTAFATYSELSHNTDNRLPTEIEDTLGTTWRSYYASSAAKGQLQWIRLPKYEDDADTDYEIRFEWDTNGKDLLNVKRNLLGVEETLASYTYYENRDLYTLTDAIGRTLTCTWNSNGLPDTITDSVTSDYVTFTYDTNWRPTGITINSHALATTAYDLEGRLLSVLSASGYLTTYDYDDLNRLKREDHPDGSFIETIWECCFPSETRSGIKVGNVDKLLQRTLFKHDPMGRFTRATDTAGGITQYVYDAAGRMTHLLDPAANDTEWHYDSVGRLGTKIYPDTTEEIYQWTDDYLSYFTNRRSQVTEFQYDSHRNQYLTTTPEAAEETQYDTWDRPDELWHTPTGGSRETHSLAHDLLGRLTEIDGPWSNDTISWQYLDADHKVIRTTPGGVTTEVTGDAIGRIYTILNPLGLFTNYYQDNSSVLDHITHTNGNANGTSYSGFNTAFTWYDDSLRQALHSITSKRPGDDIMARHTYGYDSQDHINSWQREANLANPIGTTREYTWTLKHDFNSQLTDVLESATPSSAVQSAWHFNYDAAANLRSAQHTPASNQAVSVNTRAHNNLNQITGLSGGGSTLVRGTLDEPGNVAVGITGHSDRPAKMVNETTFEADLDLPPGTTSNISVTAQDGSGNRSHYTYDVEVASETARSFEYDDDGNLTSDGVRTYAWDSQSRLTLVTWIYGKTTEFIYNGLGQRAERTDTDGGTATHYYYLYDDISMVDRRSGTTPNTATIDRRYFTEGEKRLTSGTWENYHYCRDHLGSIREVVKWDGTLVARYDYDPYGKRQTQYQSNDYTGGCDVGFTGHISLPSLESGQAEILLAHYRAYDPELARWLSADPIAELGGVNLYRYARNSSVNFIDSLGLLTEVLTFDPVGHGKSSCGHTAININGITYSFGENGWFSEPTGDYLKRNNFRNAHGQVLKLTPDQEANLLSVIKEDIKNKAKWDLTTSNCSTKQRDMLESGTNQPFSVGPRCPILPADLQRNLESFGYVERTNYYPKK